MEVLNMKKNIGVLAGIGAGAATLLTQLALAAPAIANDTLSGLPQLGTDLGDFLTALAPGVGVFIIILGVFGGVAAIVYAIVSVIRKKVGR
jgi:hypothetical protein